MHEVTLHDILEDGHYINEIEDDQFTGVYSERWRYKNTDYELVWCGKEVVDWELYRSPEQKREDREKLFDATLKDNWKWAK